MGSVWETKGERGRTRRIREREANKEIKRERGRTRRPRENKRERSSARRTRERDDQHVASLLLCSPPPSYVSSGRCSPRRPCPALAKWCRRVQVLQNLSTGTPDPGEKCDGLHNQRVTVHHLCACEQLQRQLRAHRSWGSVRKRARNEGWGAVAILEQRLLSRRNDDYCSAT